MLFNLAVDTFEQMIAAINRTLPARGITRKIRKSILAFQYADDMVVIAPTDIQSLISLKLIIMLFASISGLKVNYAKSTFIPLNVQETDIPWVQAVLGCSRSNFSFPYLGLPLSMVKPNKVPAFNKKNEKKLGS